MASKNLVRALVIAAAIISPVSAQTPAGSISGHIIDSTSLSLPGVTVTLQGADATKSFVTEADGRYRFLELAPGSYKLTFALQGFSTTVRDNLILDLGKSVGYDVSMQLSNVQEVLTVTAASPMVDVRE